MSRLRTHHSFGLGWLAWLTGLLPVIGVMVSTSIAMAHGLVPTCNPLVEGCASISATGRYFPASLAFRAAILPTAALTVLFWLASWQWLKSIGTPGRLAVNIIPVTGTLAAIFLVIYVSFLGTDGDVYRFMRRFGVIHYFSMTYLSQLFLARALYHHPAAPPGPRRLMVGLCTAMLGLGLVAILVDLAAWDTNPVENVMEWNGGLLMMLFFPATAWAWRRTGFRLQVHTRQDD